MSKLDKIRIHYTVWSKLDNKSQSDIYLNYAWCLWDNEYLRCSHRYEVVQEE